MAIVVKCCKFKSACEVVWLVGMVPVNEYQVEKRPHFGKTSDNRKRQEMPENC